MVALGPIAPNVVILGVWAVVKPETGISAICTVFRAVTITRAQIVGFGQLFVICLAWSGVSSTSAFLLHVALKLLITSN